MPRTLRIEGQSVDATVPRGALIGASVALVLYLALVPLDSRAVRDDAAKWEKRFTSIFQPGTR